MILFPFKIWKHTFSTPCIYMFSELIWKFPINDVKICHESEPKHLTANPLLKSENPHWADFCSITERLPRIFFLRAMMSQRKYTNSFLIPLTCVAKFPLTLGPAYQLWCFPSPYRSLASIFALWSLVCSIYALIWTQMNLETASSPQWAVAQVKHRVVGPMFFESCFSGFLSSYTTFCL